MAHLDFNDIVKFVSINELNEENAEFTAKVNRHLCKCSYCRSLAAAMLQINDEFDKECTERTELLFEKRRNTECSGR